MRSQNLFRQVNLIGMRPRCLYLIDINALRFANTSKLGGRGASLDTFNKKPTT